MSNLNHNSSKNSASKLLPWKLLYQHKAGLFMALICGIVIGIGLATPQQPETPVATVHNNPMLALFNQAGWANDQRYVVATPSDSTEDSISENDPVIAAAVSDDTQQQTETTASENNWLPATEALIKQLRQAYPTLNNTQAANTGHSRNTYRAVAMMPTSSSFDDAANSALAMPALSRGSLLGSVVSASAAKVEVTQGKAVILNLNEPVSRVTISNSEIAKASLLSPTEIQLVGETVGVANVILWSSFGGEQDVIDVVVHRDLSLLRSQLKLLDSRLSVKAADDAGAVALTGNVESPETAQRAMELAQTILQTTLPTDEENADAPASNKKLSPIRIVNLIEVNGHGTSKLSIIRSQLKAIHPNIRLDIVRGSDGKEKAVLSGHVKNSMMVSQAINAAAIFYGQPGIKIITGPGGNKVSSEAAETFHTGDAFSSNISNNILQGSLITDTSGNVVSLLTVAERPQVRLTIKFLEINRNDLNQLGASVAGVIGNNAYGSFSGNQGANRAFSSSTATATSASGAIPTGSNLTIAQAAATGLTQVFSLGEEANVYLSALIEKRQVRSLSEPTLTMLSGEKSSFLAGGEVPIPVALINGQVSVEFKEFGVRMNVVPTVVDDQHISLQVAPEVSTVDSTIFVDAGGINIPGFRTRRMQTTLEVQDGEQLVMAGLFSNEDVRVNSRFPILGSLPVIGALFSGRSRDSDKTEMIVLIRPEIIKRSTTDPVKLSNELSKRELKLETTLKKAKEAKEEDIDTHLIPLKMPSQDL